VAVTLWSRCTKILYLSFQSSFSQEETIVNNGKNRLTILIIAAISLLTLALPAFAQGPADFDYRFEGMTLNPADQGGALLRTRGDTTVFQFFGTDTFTYTLMARCMTDDPACLNGGLDGQPLIVIITGLQGPVDPTTLSYELKNVRVTSLKIGDRDFGPIPMNGYGNLSCADVACQTVNVQMAACSANGPRQLGMVITGVVDGADFLVWQRNMQTAGDYSLQWQSLGGTAYLTREGTPNPICGGRDLGMLFVDAYDPLAVDDLPGRSAAPLPADLPEIEGGRVDRNVLIDIVSVGLRDSEIILNVKGYFFGQCGVEPQARVGVGDDANPARVLIYRVIPEDTTCTGGMEPFSLLLPYIEQDNLYKADDRYRVNINGQIIAILIG
jgi:hypothetical protein